MLSTHRSTQAKTYTSPIHTLKSREFSNLDFRFHRSPFRPFQFVWNWSRISTQTSDAPPPTALLPSPPLIYTLDSSSSAHFNPFSRNTTSPHRLLVHLINDHSDSFLTLVNPKQPFQQIYEIQFQSTLPQKKKSQKKKTKKKKPTKNK